MDGVIRYLNTDVDLVSPDDLTGLAAALDSRGVIPLHVVHGENGLWYATLETEAQHRDPEQNIAQMIGVIESLEVPHRSIWRGCTLREFKPLRPQ